MTWYYYEKKIRDCENNNWEQKKSCLPIILERELSFLLKMAQDVMLEVCVYGFFLAFCFFDVYKHIYIIFAAWNMPCSPIIL